MHGIHRPLISLHDHNESARVGWLLGELEAGKQIALISDAGTPLISDPGYRLVASVRQAGFDVVPIPGPCALVAALSAAGLPTDRFLFHGFLPAKAVARREVLATLEAERGTLVFYESPRRVEDLLLDIETVFGADRPLCLAKELTKSYERFISGTAAEVLALLRSDPALFKGEFVVLVEGARHSPGAQVSPAVMKALRDARQYMPLKKACKLVADLTGVASNRLYELALQQDES
jgi:16S rRNA (cytidine1402-2'-O)-methyltransferase